MVCPPNGFRWSISTINLFTMTTQGSSTAGRFCTQVSTVPGGIVVRFSVPSGGPASEEKSPCHPFDRTPPAGHAARVAVPCDFYADRACNAELWDEQGRRHIDFAGGIGVLNSGHLHLQVAAAVQQMQRFSHTCYRCRALCAVCRGGRAAQCAGAVPTPENRLFHLRCRGGGKRRQDRPGLHGPFRRDQL